MLKNTYIANEHTLKKHLSDRHFRKVRKLANNPELFVKDVITKRTEQARKYLPIKHSGHFQYTVVSAVYNVEKYLDEYFDSLVNQSLNFKKHIHLILVDDGSTDNSANIIKRWQKKYPKNIHYYYKENGGIASARNLGLRKVRTEWVTFIDSDDKIHSNYFKIIDDVLSRNDNIGLAVGNLYFYFEENKSIKNTHSLNYRFHKSLNIVPIKELDKNINLFVTVSFFKTDILHKNNIIFNEKIKPNFEDGKFLADYFLCADTQKVAYIKNAIFYYRKRGDGSSTIDTSWLKREKYLNLTTYGYLPMLEQYQKKYGKIPKNIQWTIIYEIGWHIKTLINNDYKIAFLTDSEKEQYYQTIKQVISYIDDEHILDFNLIGLWYLYKVGIFGLKNKKPPFNIAYVENLDKEKQQVLVVYQQYFDTSVSFCLDGIDVLPKHKKIVNYNFAEQTFVHEIRAWIPYENVEQKLSVDLDGCRARLSVFGRQHPQWSIKHILEKFTPSEKYQSDGSWLLMDRDTQADDNAEHLYRYIMNNYPEQDCYFALRKSSHNYKHLEQEGFKILDFGSPEFEHQLRKSSKIISSHFDKYITDYFGDEYEHSKKFIFLQHGVIKDNLSRWLNYKRNMLCFVTTTEAEHHSIADDKNSYQSGKKEMVLTGLPRHDTLLKHNNLHSSTILIMPTWRASIVGKSTQTGNERLYNPNFMQTDYAQHWYNFLHNPTLKALSEHYGYQVIFAPHANIAPYLPEFKVPSYIEIWDSKTSNESIQSLFQRSKLMITDYSSVAFEMAYLNKTVLYYQFDKDEFFNGGHIFQQGYFDYEKHGFGAVATTEAELLVALEQVLQNDGKPVEPYATRIRETFPFRDGKCCERVYQAILDLDKPDDGSVDLKILADMVESAKTHRVWHLIESRCQKQLKISPLNATERYHSEQAICQAMYMQGKYVELVNFLETASLNDDEKAYWQIKLDFWLQKYDEVCNHFETHGVINNQDKLLALLAFAYTQNESAFIEMLDNIDIESLSQTETQLLKITEFIFEQDNHALSELLIELLGDDENAITWTKDELQIYKPQLILAKSLIAQEGYKPCHHYLNRYKEQVADDYACRLIFAQMDFAKGGYKWSVVHYEYLLDMPVQLNQTDYSQYLIALCQENQIDKLADIDTEILLSNEQLLKSWVTLQIRHQEWQKLNELFVQNSTLQQSMIYEYVLSQVRMGKYNGLDKVLPKPIYGNTYEYWRLAFDVATINDNIELQKYCHKGMIAIFPNNEQNANIFGEIS